MELIYTKEKRVSDPTEYDIDVAFDKLESGEFKEFGLKKGISILGKVLIVQKSLGSRYYFIAYNTKNAEGLQSKHQYPLNIAKAALKDHLKGDKDLITTYQFTKLEPGKGAINQIYNEEGFEGLVKSGKLDFMNPWMIHASSGAGFICGIALIIYFFFFIDSNSSINETEAQLFIIPLIIGLLIIWVSLEFNVRMTKRLSNSKKQKS